MADVLTLELYKGNYNTMNKLSDPILSAALNEMRELIAQNIWDDNNKSIHFLVTAIVSTYNAEYFIDGCLKSLVNQTIYKKNLMEIIVIDSHSQENEKAIIEKYQAQYKYIRYLRTKNRVTVYQAWNRAIRMAKSKYITNANTDDRLRADAIEVLVNLLEKKPDKMIAYGNSLVTTVANETFEENSAEDTLDWPDFDRNTMHSYCYIGPHPVWRRKLHNEIGYFDSSLKSAADWEFWLRAAQKHDFVHLDEYVGLYYLSDETVSRKGNLPLIEADYVRKKYKPTYQRIVDDIILPKKLQMTKQGKNNLLICTHNFPPFFYAGTENYVLNIAKSLKYRGINVHVFFPHIDPNQAAPELRKMQFEGIQTLQLWSDGKEYFSHLNSGGKKLLKIFDKLLKHNNYDIVHFHHFKEIPLDFVNLVKKKRIPYAVTLHDFNLACIRYHLFIYEKWRICDGPDPVKCAKCLFQLYKLDDKTADLNATTELIRQKLDIGKEIINSAALVTGPSQFVIDKFKQYGFDYGEKIKVIPLGLKEIKAPFFKKNKRELNFGFLGTITPLKNVLLMVQAFMETRGKAKLCIWGAGEKTLIKLIDKYRCQDPRIEYRGSYTPDDLPDIFKEVDVAIIPSLIESYSLVVREAFMAKIPVIASEVGGITEIVQNGKNGLLFNPFQKRSLTDCIQKVIDNPDMIKQFVHEIPTIKTIDQDVDYLIREYSTLAHGFQNRKAIEHNSEKNLQGANKKAKVMVFSFDAPGTACASVRILHPFSFLKNNIEVYWCVGVKNTVAKVKDDLIEIADLIIIQRGFPCKLTLPIIEKCLKSGKPVIYEIDDNLFEMPADNPNNRVVQDNIPILIDIIRKCHAVTVSTNELKKKLIKTNSNIHVLPNFIHDNVWNFQKKRYSDKEQLTIGYAGTSTHEADLSQIESAVKKINKNYNSRIKFLFFGCATDYLQNECNVDCVKFENNYETYAEKLQKLDIDIMVIPLVNNEFNRCKSNIKWLEISSCGIPGIYSDLPPYNSCVEHLVNGILVNDSSQNWYEAMVYLIENLDARKRIGQKAQQDVMNGYRMSTHAYRYLDAYQDIGMSFLMN